MSCVPTRGREQTASATGTSQSPFSPGLSFIICKTAEGELDSITFQVPSPPPPFFPSFFPFTSKNQRLCGILGSSPSSPSEAVCGCSRRAPQLCHRLLSAYCAPGTGRVEAHFILQLPLPGAPVLSHFVARKQAQGAPFPWLTAGPGRGTQAF